MIFEYLERPRSTGGDLEIAKCWYNFYHKDELHDRMLCGDIALKNQSINVLK